MESRMFPVSFQDTRFGGRGFQPLRSWLISAAPSERNKGQILGEDAENFCHLTKIAEPPPPRDVNRDSGMASANGGRLRRLVRPHGCDAFTAYHACGIQNKADHLLSEDRKAV